MIGKSIAIKAQAKEDAALFDVEENQVKFRINVSRDINIHRDPNKGPGVR